MSKKLRGCPATRGAVTARTTAPCSTAWANTANSEPRKTSVTSAIRSGFRRSGLSVPYFAIASSNGTRGNGGGVTAAPPPNSSKTPCSTGSIAAKTSSWVTNDISKSSW